MLYIKQIQKKDFNHARKFALEGMHFEQYTTNKIALYFYSKYFWYLELSRATTALGTYDNNKLVGVLLAEIKGQQTIFKSLWYQLYIKFVNFIMKVVYKEAQGPYDKANKEMLDAFTANNNTNGELIFFAADPKQKGKGIGSLLLRTFEKQEAGKTIYLFTDSNCTYQFYEHRGFETVGQKEIYLEINGKHVPLTCFLFSKTFAHQ